MPDKECSCLKGVRKTQGDAEQAACECLSAQELNSLPTKIQEGFPALVHSLHWVSQCLAHPHALHSLPSHAACSVAENLAWILASFHLGGLAERTPCQRISAPCLLAWS